MVRKTLSYVFVSCFWTVQIIHLISVAVSFCILYNYGTQLVFCQQQLFSTWYKCLRDLVQIVYCHQTVAHSEDGRISASIYWVLRGWATLWCMV